MHFRKSLGFFIDEFYGMTDPLSLLNPTTTQPHSDLTPLPAQL